MCRDAPPATAKHAAMILHTQPTAEDVHDSLYQVVRGPISTVVYANTIVLYDSMCLANLWYLLRHCLPCSLHYVW
jgi:hypothetical protein